MYSFLEAQAVPPLRLFGLFVCFLPKRALKVVQLWRFFRFFLLFLPKKSLKMVQLWSFFRLFFVFFASNRQKSWDLGVSWGTIGCFRGSCSTCSKRCSTLSRWICKVIRTVVQVPQLLVKRLYVLLLMFLYIQDLFWKSWGTWVTPHGQVVRLHQSPRKERRLLKNYVYWHD